MADRAARVSFDSLNVPVPRTAGLFTKPTASPSLRKSTTASPPTATETTIATDHGKQNPVFNGVGSMGPPAKRPRHARHLPFVHNESFDRLLDTSPVPKPIARVYQGLQHSSTTIAFNETVLSGFGATGPHQESNSSENLSLSKKSKLSLQQSVPEETNGSKDVDVEDHNEASRPRKKRRGNTQSTATKTLTAADDRTKTTDDSHQTISVEPCDRMSKQEEQEEQELPIAQPEEPETVVDIMVDEPSNSDGNIEETGNESRNLGKTPKLVKTMKVHSKTPRKAPPVAVSSRMTRSTRTEKTSTGSRNPSPGRESRRSTIRTETIVLNKSTLPFERSSAKKKAVPPKQDVSIKAPEAVLKPAAKASAKTTITPPNSLKTPESVSKQLGLKIPPHILAATGSAWDPHSGRRQSRRKTLTILGQPRPSLPAQSMLVQPSSAPPKLAQKRNHNPSKVDDITPSRTRNLRGRFMPKSSKSKEDKGVDAGGKDTTGTPPPAKAGIIANKKKSSSKKDGTSKTKTITVVEKDPYDFSDEE